MLNSNYAIVIILSSISWVVGASTARASIIKPGTIILLNGTSSAGKSSIVKELQNIYEHSFSVASIDGFIRERSIDWSNDKIDWDDLWIQFYTHIKSISDSGKIILIDTVCYEKEYEKYNAILGSQLIKILVYCPLDIIINHVEKRNNLGDTDEHRSLYQACKQFLSLYSAQNLSENFIIDQIDSTRIMYVLDKVKEETNKWSQEKKDGDETDYQKTYTEIYQEFEEKFHLHEVDTINLIQIYSWDFTVTAGTNSSAITAQEIALFIDSQFIIK